MNRNSSPGWRSRWTAATRRDALAARDPFQLLAHHPEAIAAPENLAVDDIAGNPEHAERFGLALDALVLAPSLAGKKVHEPRCARSALLDHTRDRIRILDIEFALPEALEHDVVVFAEHFRLLREEHPDRRDR